MSHAASNPQPRGQRIAVVGAGISGLASAYLLSRHNQVTLFEAGSYPGGHTNTVDVTLDGHTHPVDTGFLVFNDRTYPNLIALFAELGVEAHPSEMTFSVSLDEGRLEWAGTSLNTVFAQRRNLFSPTFIGMLRDIMRFNGSARAQSRCRGANRRVDGRTADGGRLRRRVPATLPAADGRRDLVERHRRHPELSRPPRFCASA